MARWMLQSFCAERAMAHSHGVMFAAVPRAASARHAPAPTPPRVRDDDDDDEDEADEGPVRAAGWGGPRGSPFLL
jgi:hypothetical protein